MSSIAIWYKSKDTEKITNCDVHINYWKIQKWPKKTPRCLDIGIKIFDASNVNRVYFFIPVQFNNKKSLLDLGARISSDEKLLSSIFNKELSITTTTNDHYCSIKDLNKDESLNIYKIQSADIKTSKAFGGTIIELDLSNANKPNTYLRCRFDGHFLKGMYNIENLANSTFQGTFKKNETFDLRINEIRTLPRDLVSKMKNDGRFKIQTLHLFFICCSREAYESSFKQFKSCRTLEKDQWNGYLDDLNLRKTESLLAYHWKEIKDSGFYDYNALIKTRYELSSVLTLVVYFFLLLFLSILINLADTCLPFFKCNFKENQATEQTIMHDSTYISNTTTNFE